MMLTVTNTSGVVLNDFDTYYGYAPTPLVNAVGGQRRNPLPYPISHVVLAVGAHTHQPVHPRDFNHKAVPSMSMLPSEEFNQLVGAGKITYSIAAETNLAAADIDEAFIAACV